MDPTTPFTWSDMDLARRWLSVYPRKYMSDGTPVVPSEGDIGKRPATCSGELSVPHLLLHPERPDDVVGTSVSVGAFQRINPRRPAIWCAHHHQAPRRVAGLRICSTGMRSRTAARRWPSVLATGSSRPSPRRSPPDTTPSRRQRSGAFVARAMASVQEAQCGSGWFLPAHRRGELP